jgi:DNA-binding transcriptional regulator YhcF (GntR family)
MPEKAVLKELALYAHPKTALAFPSVRQLAADVGCSEREVQRLLRRLERRGVLRLSPAAAP